jgi:hypothetical protein
MGGKEKVDVKMGSELLWGGVDRSSEAAPALTAPPTVSIMCLLAISAAVPGDQLFL